MTWKCLVPFCFLILVAQKQTSFVDGLPSRIERNVRENPEITGKIRFYNHEEEEDDDDPVDSFEITAEQYDPDRTSFYRILDEDKSGNYRIFEEDISGQIRFKREDDDGEEDDADGDGKRSKNTLKYLLTQLNLDSGVYSYVFAENTHLLRKGKYHCTVTACLTDSDLAKRVKVL